MSRLLPLALPVTACALALASCGSASVELTGSGLLGKRFGSDARTAEAAIVDVLGKPTARMEFDGCELGGPGARERMSTVRWGALGVRYENRKTTSGYEPSKLLAWEIRRDGEIPSGVMLPGGVGRGATFGEVRDAVGVRREWQDFESNLIATSRDGVEYWFDAAARTGRVQGIASHMFFCELAALLRLTPFVSPVGERPCLRAWAESRKAGGDASTGHSKRHQVSTGDSVDSQLGITATIGREREGQNGAPGAFRADALYRSAP